MPTIEADRATEATTHDAPHWHVHLLGGLRVLPLSQAHGDTRETDDIEAFSRFRTHKAALLLARLLLYPHRSHSRDELADWLWPDAPADRGRAHLSQTLLRLRQQFADSSSDEGVAIAPLFIANHQTIRLRAQDFTTDVADFERRMREARATGTQSASAEECTALWESALQAYGGDLLPGFFDDWIEGERRRFDAMRQEAQEHWQQARAQCDAKSHIAVSVPLPAAKESALPQSVGFPLILTRFFGRTTELERIDDLLTQSPSVRLITLIGTGGIGKTRLAVETVRRLTEEASHATTGTLPPFGFVGFVSLAEVTDAAYLGSALLRDVKGESSTGKAEEALSAISHFLRGASEIGQRLLLVLDNLEQLGDTVAPTVAQLLREVPTLTILATSRQPVGVPGEREVWIGPLARDPNCDAEVSLDMHLFADRAQLVRPDFTLSAQNKDAVCNLCALLEGVPLAIELAGAWARALSPAQIAARLHNRFDLLALRGVSGSGDIPKRHRSLRAAIAWSYDLLPPSLQTFFATLSVFRGGWTMESAQAVTGIADPSEPLLLLTERSLILAETHEATGEVRYRMLESLREFAGEQLQSHEQTAILLRHARYFDALTKSANARKEAGDMREAQSLVRGEWDNLRAAITGNLQLAEADFDVSDERCLHGAWILVQSAWLWTLNEVDDYAKREDMALAHLPEDTECTLRANLALLQGRNAFSGGDYVTAKQHLCRSLALAEACGVPQIRVRAKSALARLAHRTGDTASAIASWKECLADARYLQDKRLESDLLNTLAIAVASREPTEGRTYIERAVAIDRQHASGSYLLACSLNTMAHLAAESGDYAAALPCLEEAHEIARADGAAGMLAVIQNSLAELFLLTGTHLDRAHDLLCATQRLFEQSGELPRVADVIALRFQLAIAQNAPDEAVLQAHHYLRLACENQQGAIWLAHTPADLANRLREAGFAAHAERLATLLSTSDVKTRATVNR